MTQPKNFLSQIKMVRARTPLRLSFGGGGTDVSPYADTHGGCVLNATISRYVYGTLVPKSESRSAFAPSITAQWFTGRRKTISSSTGRWIW